MSSANTSKKQAAAKQDLEALYEWMRLKVQINRYLARWTKEYQATIRLQFAWATDGLFAEVVDEMEREGLLAKETGLKGAVVLIRKEAK